MPEGLKNALAALLGGGGLAWLGRDKIKGGFRNLPSAVRGVPSAVSGATASAGRVAGTAAAGTAAAARSAGGLRLGNLGVGGALGPAGWAGVLAGNDAAPIDPNQFKIDPKTGNFLRDEQGRKIMKDGYFDRMKESIFDFAPPNQNQNQNNIQRDVTINNFGMDGTQAIKSYNDSPLNTRRN